MGIVARIAFWLIVVACIIAFFTRDDKTDNSKVSDLTEQATNKIESQNEDKLTPAIVEFIENQDFSEEAAHAYIPTKEDYKNLERKQSQKIHESENLTIVETQRNVE